MAVFSRMTVINGVLAEYAQAPVAVASDTEKSQIIDKALDRLLPLFCKSTLDWAELRRATTLSTPLTESLDSANWKYTFALPDDFGRIYSSVDGGVNRAPFRIWGRYLLTNSPKFDLTYTRVTTDYATFEAHFHDYFIYFVAAKLCMGVTRQADLQKELYKKLELSKSDAMSVERRQKGGREAQLNRFAHTGINAYVS